jgi:hypothetical protein
LATTNKFFKVKNGLDVNSNATVDASGNANIAGNLTANTGFVSADAFRLDTTYATGPSQAGEITWDPENETAQLQLDAHTIVQIGQEQVVRVKNSDGANAIPIRTAVMFAGAAGDTVTVAPANSANVSATPSDYLVGITAEEIPADGFGFVTQFGFLPNVNTAAFTLGNLLYVDPANPGQFVTTRPAAPAWQTPVGAVTKVASGSGGRILVRTIPGIKIGSVEGVEITSPANNQVLTYSSGVWINANATGGGAAGNSFETISANGTSVVADSSTDTLTLTPSNGITITGNATSDTVTISTNASDANGASTIVARNANGSFAGNVITATTFSGSGASLTSIPSIVTDDTKPSTPVDGQVWFNSATGKTYVYYEDGTSSQWVEIFGAKDIVDLKNRTIAVESNVTSTQASVSAVEANVAIAQSDITTLEGIANNRNFLINGGFDFWQRGTSSTANATYIVDRWLHSRTAGTHTVSQSTDVPTEADVQYSLSFASTSGTSPTITQRIESINSLQFAGQSVTLSVWAKSTTGTNALAWSTSYPTVIDNWAAETADASGTFAASMTVGSWTRYTATFTTNALATRGYAIKIFRNATTTSTTTLYAGVQLELGSSATRFRPAGSTYSEELVACQRYYFQTISNATNQINIGYGIAYSTTAGFAHIPLPVTMRVPPTAITVTGSFVFGNGVGGGTFTSIVLYVTSWAQSTNTVMLNCTGATGLTSAGAFRFDAGTNASIGITAEL